MRAAAFYSFSQQKKMQFRCCANAFGFISWLTFVLVFSFSLVCVQECVCVWLWDVNIKYLGKIKRKMRYC